MYVVDVGWAGPLVKNRHKQVADNSIVEGRRVTNLHMRIISVWFGSIGLLCSSYSEALNLPIDLLPRLFVIPALN